MAPSIYDILKEGMAIERFNVDEENMRCQDDKIILITKLKFSKLHPILF